MGFEAEADEVAVRQRRNVEVAFFCVPHEGGEVAESFFAFGGCYGGAGGLVFGFGEGGFGFVGGGSDVPGDFFGDFPCLSAVLQDVVPVFCHCELVCAGCGRPVITISFSLIFESRGV